MGREREARLRDAGMGRECKAQLQDAGMGLGREAQPQDAAWGVNVKSSRRTPAWGMNVKRSCRMPAWKLGAWHKVYKKWENSMIKEPIRVGTMMLMNRLVMPPMATYKSTEDGKVTEELLAYYRERSRGGRIGLIITEHSYIEQRGKARVNQLSIASDSDIDGLRRLTDVIRQSGTKVMAQLNHAGSAAPSSATGSRAVSASSVILPVRPMMGDGTEPEALTQEQIRGVIQSFADAARRAQEAGYDGVEIHSAHAYLLNQFYSPLTNQRSDVYGGSLENRLRIHMEVIQAVRKVVGDAYPVAVRLGGCDYTEGGSSIQDCAAAAKAFEQAGVDLIDLSGGMCRYMRPDHDEPGYFQDMSRAVRETVSIPVLLTGGITDIRDADRLLEAGAADLIGVGRALLKNPKWADEAMRE